MVKLIHTADLHLDSPLSSLALRDEHLRRKVRAATRSALKSIVCKALEHEAAAVLISGDLFDRAERSARTAAFLIIQMNHLKQAGIRVFYIKGNHDAENPITGETELPDNVHVFTGHGGAVEIEGAGVCIHGVSFSGKSAPDSLIPKLRSPLPDIVNIAMMHSSVAGSPGHDRYAPCSVSDMEAAGFDYWALGHIHKRTIYSERPWIVMPGIPQGRDIGESGPKSATLITVEDGVIAVEELLTSEVEFGEAQIDINGLAGMDALHSEIRESLHRHSSGVRSPHAIVRPILTGHSKLSWQINRDREILIEFIRETAADIGNMSIDKVKFEVTAEPEPGSPDASEELAGIMAELAADPSIMSDFARDSDAVLKFLPREVRNRLLTDERAAEALTARLSEAGSRRVASAIRAAPS